MVKQPLLNDSHSSRPYFSKRSHKFQGFWFSANPFFYKRTACFYSKLFYSQRTLFLSLHFHLGQQCLQIGNAFIYANSLRGVVLSYPLLTDRFVELEEAGFISVITYSKNGTLVWICFFTKSPPSATIPRKYCSGKQGLTLVINLWRDALGSFIIHFLSTFLLIGM